MTGAPCDAMKTALITGADGVVGSIILATLVQYPNLKIVTLGKNAIDFARLSNAFKSYPGLPIGEAVAGRVVQIPLEDAQTPEALDQIRRNHGITEIWHCAASLSHELNRLQETFHINARFTQRLRTTWPYVDDFVYISTIGITGTDEQPRLLPESQVFDYSAMSPYTLSKYLGELHLVAHAAQFPAGPAAIVRLANIVGDSQTGWFPSNTHGYYSFLQFLKKARKLNRNLSVDACADGQPAVVHCDHLIAFIQRRRAIAADQPGISTYNAVASKLLTASEHVGVWQATSTKDSAVRLSMGPPLDAFNSAINSVNADNLRFFGSQNVIENANFAALLKDWDISLKNESLTKVVGYALWN